MIIKVNYKYLFSLYMLVSCVSAIDVQVTCADDMTLYADGQTIGTHNNKGTSKKLSLQANTKVVGIKCVANSLTSASGGILASFTMEYPGDFITDATWKCSNKLETGWNNADFDDKYWQYATVIGNNTNIVNSKPSGMSYISSISQHADWIWNSNPMTQNGDRTVYCRAHMGLEETRDNRGRKFVIGFMQNKDNAGTDLKLLFTTSKPTPVTVRITTPLITPASFMHKDRTVKLAAGEIQVVTLHYSLRNSVSHSIEQKSVLVIATANIKVIGENHETYTTDLFLALPVTSLGNKNDKNDYYVVSWNAANSSRLLVISTYDSTQVKITVTDTILYKSKSYSKGQTINIAFPHKYESLQLKLDTVIGFTGTKISSNKPITVYSGNRRAGVDGITKAGTSDHLVEQLTPLKTWGKKFILTPLPYGAVGNTETRSATILCHYVIVSAEDATSFTIEGYVEDSSTATPTISATLNAGESYVYTHTRGTVGIVKSSKGIMVAQVATSNQGNEMCLGDPWLQLIPPAYQYAMDYTLLTPEMTQRHYCNNPIHYFTIIINKQFKDGLLHNNNKLTSSFHSIVNSEFVYQTVKIAYGVHRIQHEKASVSFGLYFFGYGAKDSYASMGGTRMAPINMPCVVTPSTMGDGLDNDCDEQIDEDECLVPDPSKDCGPPSPVNGGWSNWKASASCVCSNGVGTQAEKRTCDNPVPMYDGWPCDRSQSFSRVVSCSCVPIDGQWSSWTQISDCSVTCDQGTTTRSRSCTNPKPANGGAVCAGNNTDYPVCTKSPCPINGGWSLWTQWASCVCPLGETDGKQTYNRTCTNPVPQYNGTDCDSSVNGLVKEENCNCPPVVCNKLPVIENGFYDHPNCSTTGRIYRDVCKGTCNTGYYNIADETFTCTKYGTWSSNNYTQCQIYHCPAIPSVTSNTKCPGCIILPKILNAEYDKHNCTDQGLDYNNNCTASCDMGYNLVGVQQLWCNAFGKWDSNIPRCEISHCNALPIPGNGSYFPPNCQTNGLDYPQPCSLVCNYAFIPVGFTIQTCSSEAKWTYEINGTLPYCKFAVCDTLPKEGINSTLSIPHGKLLFGMYVTYTCIEGHTLSLGDINRYCKLNGDWSGYPLICKPVQCIPLVLPLYASIVTGNQSMYEYKEVIEYKCDTGYEWLGGDLIRTCKGDASFSGFEPVCRKKLCYDLPVIPNSRILVGAGDTFDFVNYECLEGYKHVTGNLVRHCLLNKTWNGTSPTCSEIVCPDPPIILNTYHHSEGISYKNKTMYYCSNDYEKIGGDDHLVCNISGMWEGNTLQCQAKLCGSAPNMLLNTTYGYSTYDKSVHLCYEGYYHRSGISTSMCLGTMQWEIIYPVCEEITCGVPDIVKGTVFKLGPAGYNSIVEYQCSAGYIPTKSISTCNEGGWTVPNIDCLEKTCKIINNLPGVVIQYNIGVKHLDGLIWNCASGYTLINGDTGRICMDGQWTGVDLNCEKTKCEEPSYYEPANMSRSGVYVHDMVKYSCSQNQKYKYGDESRSCTYSSTWNGTAAVCEETQCRELKNQWPRIIYYAGFTKCSNAVVTCAKGFKFHGNIDSEYNIQCDESGNWSRIFPICKAINCGPPPTISYTELVYNTTNYLDQVKIIPDQGYYLVDGDNHLLCEEDGFWVGDLPKTKAKECPMPVLPPFGTLKLTGLTVGSMVYFECEENYTISGDVTLFCMSNATWSVQFPTCIEKRSSHKSTTIAESFKLDLVNTTRGAHETYTAADHIITHVIIGILFLFLVLLVLFLFCIIDASNLKRDFHYLKESLS